MTKLFFILSVLVLYLHDLCGGYKFLVVFPVPNKSHTILGDAYVRHLLAANHEVTYITANPTKNNNTKLRQIDVSSNYGCYQSDKMMNMTKLMDKEVVLNDLLVIFQIMYNITNSTLMQRNVQEFLHDPKEEFDAVIVEWLYNELYSGFSVVFNCPLIWSSSMEPYGMVLSLIDEEPNPAYSPDHLSSKVPPLTFWERATELWALFYINFHKWLASFAEIKLYERAFSSAVTKRGRVLPPYDSVRYNGSLMLGNSHVSTGQAISLPQNYVHILGYHISNKLEPLPDNLKKLMDNAANGVIYFSMGTNLKSKDLPTELKKSILQMFGELKQTVIWKFEEVLSDLPENVHIIQWAPQQSILSHPNCLLFITHGGLLSTTETIHYGVPVIGIPVFADQFINVDRAVAKGFAKRVDLSHTMVPELKNAILDVLTNPKYRERVKELSLIYHDRPVFPGRELVHWVEHVVKTGGAPHLRSPALSVPLYQKLYLDLIAFCILILVNSIILIRLLVSYNSNRNTRNTEKKKN